MKRRSPSSSALLAAAAAVAAVDATHGQSTGEQQAAPVSVGLPQQTNKPVAPPTSLYQQCLTLTDRLMCVPGFDRYLEPGINPDVVTNLDGSFSPSMDPVRALWTAFRTGAALCVLFNAARPSEPLDVSDLQDISNVNARKKGVYRFLVGCKKEFNFPEDRLFSITELYQDDTNGFVKVIRTVGDILSRIQEQGTLVKSRRPSLRLSDIERVSVGPMGNREKVVTELLETERKYVSDLEELQNYMRQLQQADVVSQETIRWLFVNLNSLVDFQRRFLIGVEANAQLPPNDQRFGLLFVQMEEGFGVYEPFCANYSSASELAVQEAPNLAKLAHILEPTYALPALLIKPIQRLCKYPLLLNELIKFTDAETYPHYQELLDGLEAIKRVADRVNEERRKQENAATVADLTNRVDDWKGHSPETFGKLLLSDKFVMATNDLERELHIYLFEKILLCCKESGNSKKRSGTAAQFIKRATKGTIAKRASLQLKGRVFITSVTGVINNSKNGQYALKVFWTDAEMESFTLKCRNEEQLKLWKSTLARLVDESTREKAALSMESRGMRSTNSAPNLNPQAVQASLNAEAAAQTETQRQQQQALGSRPPPRRAMTTGPLEFNSLQMQMSKGRIGPPYRDEDTISFIFASDDEDEEDEPLFTMMTNGVADAPRYSWEEGSQHWSGKDSGNGLPAAAAAPSDVGQRRSRTVTSDSGRLADGSTTSGSRTPPANTPANSLPLGGGLPSNLPGMSFPPLPRSGTTYLPVSPLPPVSQQLLPVPPLPRMASGPLPKSLPSSRLHAAPLSDSRQAASSEARATANGPTVKRYPCFQAG